MLYFRATAAFGWINTKMCDATKDEKASQGWCPTVLDTNGDGKITKPWNEPRPAEGHGRRRLRSDAGHARADRRYATASSPTRSTSRLGRDRRLPGRDLPPGARRQSAATCNTERYSVPKELGYRPRGVDVDRNGVIWTALA